MCLDKIQFDRLKNLQFSHEQLEEKYLIAQRLEEQLKELNKHYQEKIELIDTLQRDYEREHQARLQAEKSLQIGSVRESQMSDVDQNIRDENEKLHHTIRELNDKIERQNSTENVQVNSFFVHPSYFFIDHFRN